MSEKPVEVKENRKEQVDEAKPKVAEASKPVKFESKDYYNDDLDDFDSIPELKPASDSKPNVFV